MIFWYPSTCLLFKFTKSPETNLADFYKTRDSLENLHVSWEFPSDMKKLPRCTANPSCLPKSPNSMGDVPAEFFLEASQLPSIVHKTSHIIRPPVNLDETSMFTTILNIHHLSLGLFLVMASRIPLRSPKDVM